MKKITVKCWKCNGEGYITSPYLGEGICSECPVCDGECKIKMEIIEEEV